MFPSNCYFSQYASTCFDLVSVRQLAGLTGKKHLLPKPNTFHLASSLIVYLWITNLAAT